MSNNHVKTYKNKLTGEISYSSYRLDHQTMREALLDNYLIEYGIADNEPNKPNNNYGSSSSFSAESYYSGGIRESLTGRYLTSGIYDRFGLSISEWFDTPHSKAMHILKIAEDLTKIENNNKNTEAKKNEELMKQLLDESERGRAKSPRKKAPMRK